MSPSRGELNHKTGGGHLYRDMGRAGSAQAAYKGSGSSSGLGQKGGVGTGSGAANGPSEREKRIVKTFHAECKRALRTGFRLIYPRHGAASVACIPFFDLGKEAAVMLAHHMFTLRCNPSEAAAIEAQQEVADLEAAAASEQDSDLFDEDGLMPQQPPTLRTTTSSPGVAEGKGGGFSLSPASSPTSRRITVEQIKSARDEAMRQERAWAKAIGKAVT